MEKTTRYLTKVFLSVCLIISVVTTAYGQKKNDYIKELKIGDTIPKILVRQIINHGQNRPIADLYKQGLLIINFWATWCAPCLHELPLLEKLKVEYPQNLNIISVAYEDSLTIKRFLKTHKEIKIPHLMMVTNDTIFKSYFTHKYLPHNIWIDRKGIIRAITNSEEITNENIIDFLKDNDLHLNIKKDNGSFKYNKPFHLLNILMA
jgi:thiol-disulfide isomerase/thioredoxin